MEIKNFEKFNGLVGELLWYPKTFCQSEGAVKWETVPSRNYFSTPWMDFFCGLKDGSFGKLAEALACENLHATIEPRSKTS
ncbi:hypothetical protein [Sphingobacterium puteale]|uniref:hypothetical protein n=1 Tax=Sphingobacterium puteale TaxID=2420510 RepID=UPI003D979D05